MEVTEGGLTIDVPEQDGSSADVDVFYNPEMELNRDLTVAVLRAYRSAREPRAGTYLDAMAASGIRGVRAAADGWDVTCCDADPAAAERCRENLAGNDLDAEVVCRDVNALLYESETVFDVVDLDPFGTPIPYADAAFANARDLVCVTATDTAPLCGAHFASGVRTYGAVPRNTEYHAEMGLRVLVSALARTAARYDVGVEPILSHATRHYARTYLELSHRATDADRTIDALGYVHHCQDCLYREHAAGLVADPPAACPACGSNRLVSAGPIWLEPVRDRAFVESVRATVIDGAGESIERSGEPNDWTGEPVDEFGEAAAIDRLLGRLAGELDQPTHYDQHRLYKQWGEPAIGMDPFLDRVREAGFEASRTHYGGTTFKTTASVPALTALFGDGS